MATGNHFLLDAVAGFVVVGAGLGVAVVGERLVRDLGGGPGVPAPRRRLTAPSPGRDETPAVAGVSLQSG